MFPRENVGPLPNSRRRRSFRFSLKALLFSILILSIFLGYIMNRARIQKRAVQAIREAGGVVLYEFQATDGSLHPSRLPATPPFLRSMLGDDVIYGVEFVNLAGCSLNENTTAQLAKLGTIKILYLSDTNITDTTLARLRSLNRLKCLELCDTTISDFGLVNFEEMKNMEHLDLSGTNITDQGLPRLTVLTSLRYLAVIGTNISDDGLVHLMELKELEYLELLDTNVTRAGVAKVEDKLPNCDSPELADSRGFHQNLFEGERHVNWKITQQESRSPDFHGCF